MAEISPYVRSGEKRALDFIVATPFYAFFGYPLSLALRSAVMLDTGGPTIVDLERTTGGSRRIKMPKIRSMDVGSENDYFVDVRSDDPRITRMGHILRPSGLDELPQLGKVVSGEMSLVNL